MDSSALSTRTYAYKQELFPNQQRPYLRDVDASLLEGAVVGVLGAYVAVLAPVTRERAVYAGKAAKAEETDRVEELAGPPVF